MRIREFEAFSRKDITRMRGTVKRNTLEGQGASRPDPPDGGGSGVDEQGHTCKEIHVMTSHTDTAEMSAANACVVGRDPATKR